MHFCKDSEVHKKRNNDISLDLLWFSKDDFIVFLFCFRIKLTLKSDTTSEPIRDAMKVTVKSWTGVATWRWIANDDNCGICRMPFDSCCPDCKLPGDDCPLVWGACSHCFHIHCIVKWLHSQPQQQCPMCRQDWKFNNK